MFTKKCIYLALIVLSFLAYANSLNNSFLSIDDIPAILENPWISYPLKSWDSPSELLNSFIYKVARFNVIPYHLASIILHCLVTILVFNFLSLFFNREASFLAATLFAIHPVHTEAVTWISGRPYIILTFFTLLTYLLYYRATNQDGVDKKSRNLNYALSLGIFSYFIIRNFSFYFLFPFFIILSDVVFNRWRKNYKFWIPFLALTILRVILAVGVIQQRLTFTLGYEPTNIKILRNPFFPFIYSLFSHFWLLLWPLKLTFFHEPIVFYPLAMWLGAMALVILVYFLPHIFKRAKSIFLGIGMFILFLLPTYSPLPVTSVVTERYAYLPSILLSILAAFFYEKYSFTKRRRNWLIAGFVFLIAAYGTRTIIRNTDWRDNRRFSKVTLEHLKDTPEIWRAALAASPSSAHEHNNRGAVYIQEGNIDKAIEEFNTAIKIAPKYFRSYKNLGILYLRLGKKEEAIALWRKAIEIDPAQADAYYNLGILYVDIGNITEAVASFKKAIEIFPAYSNAYDSLGVIYSSIGKGTEAINSFNKAIELNPTCTRTYNNFGGLYSRMGKDKEAAPLYKRAIEINPYDCEGHLNLAEAYFRMKDYDLAIKHCDKALELQCDVPSEFLKVLEVYRSKK